MKFCPTFFFDFHFRFWPGRASSHFWRTFAHICSEFNIFRTFWNIYMDPNNFSRFVPHLQIFLRFPVPICSDFSVAWGCFSP